MRRTRTGNLIVFSPGFRHVWKFKFSRVPLLVLVLGLACAGVTLMGTMGYVAPLLGDGADEHSFRLVVENQTLSVENRALGSQVQQLGERARQLEEETSRI